VDINEMTRRTAWQAGATEGAASRMIEAFLHELRAAMAEGAAVTLGDFGTFRGTSFTPGLALRPPAGAPLAEAAGYEEGTAPKDS